MGQTVEFAVGSWIVRQSPGVFSKITYFSVSFSVVYADCFSAERPSLVWRTSVFSQLPHRLPVVACSCRRPSFAVCLRLAVYCLGPVSDCRSVLFDQFLDRPPDPAFAWVFSVSSAVPAHRESTVPYGLE